MKLLNMDGSEFGEAPDWLLPAVPKEINRAFLSIDPTGACTPEIAFVVRPEGLRFYAPRDRARWQAMMAARESAGVRA